MKLIFPVFLFSILVFSCKGKTGITGDTSFNSKRKAAGLPSLPLGWVFVKDAPSMHHWYKPTDGPVPPHTYHQKWLEVHDDHVVKEENIFKGAPYVSGEDTRDEQLTVGAYFDEAGNVTRWDITYSGPSSDFMRLTKPQADSVLALWKIEMP